MSERPANDTVSPARTAVEVYIIDPNTKQPGMPGSTTGGATEVTLESVDSGVAALGALTTSANSKLDDLKANTDTLETLATATNTKLDTLIADVSPATVVLGQAEYETVAASQTAQVLGATGATGDYLAGLLVVPATTSPGAISILDNATSITVFTGGASSVSNLVPFFIPLGIKSVSGAWKVTTGANVSAIGIGDFT